MPDRTLSPGAQLITDLNRAHGKARTAGLSPERAAQIAAYFAEDLSDLADDTQWDGLAGIAAGQLRALVADGRHWSVLQHQGEIFDEDVFYEGWALTIEIRDHAEAEKVERALSGKEAPNG